MRAWYIREQKHILGTSDYAEVDLFETTDKEHTASTRRKRELATSIAQQKYNDMIARRYFCQLAYTNFGESDWAATFSPFQERRRSCENAAFRKRCAEGYGGLEKWESKLN